MRGVGRMILGCSVAAFFLTLYVHGQVNILRLSYILDERAERLAEKTDQYKRLHFEVSQLSSSKRLENKMHELSFDLTFPKEVRIIPVPSVPALKPPSLERTMVTTFQNRMAQFLGRWVGVAQARTDS